MQNILLPYTKELQRLEGFIERKGDGDCFLNSIQGRNHNDVDKMQRAKKNVFKLETIHQKKKQLSLDQTVRMEKLNEKLSHSMEHSFKKKETQLQAMQTKIKKKNQKKRVRKSSEQIELREEKEEKEQSPVKVEMSKFEIHQTKKEVTIQETPKMKLAEPKVLNEDEFYMKLNKSMEAAFQRKSQRLDYIKTKLQGQDEIINQHIEKSQKYKQEQEQNRLNQIYNKLINLTNKETMKKSQNLNKKKKKSMQLEISGSDSQKNQKWSLKETDDLNIGQSRTVRSITEDIKYIHAKQRLEKIKQEREQRVQSILDKHSLYSQRIKQNRVLLDELSNTCQYYNFKIKEQYQQ